MQMITKRAMAALVAAGLASCMTVEPSPVAQVVEGRDGYPKARISFGIGEMDTDWDRASVMELVLARDGGITLDGSAVAMRGLPARLARAGKGTKANAVLTADPEMAFADVLPLLSAIEHAPSFQLLAASFTQHRTFGDATRNGELPASAQAFRGQTETYELPVWVGFDAGKGQCAASLFGMMLDSEALYDRAFVELDRWVQDAGGVDAFLAQPAFANTRATVQAAADTPWKCVAGASFAMLTAGYPDVQWEVLPE